MAENPVVVTGLGMISSLGHDVVTSCAAARAGLARRAELETFSVYSEEEWSEVPVIGHTVAGFSDGFEGAGRLVRLASAALADLLDYAQLTPADFSRTGLYLNLPSGYFQKAYASHGTNGEPSPDVEPSAGIDELKEYCRTALANRVAELNGIRLPIGGTPVLFGDHAGVAAAILDASRRLQAGERDSYVVGGIDCCVESDFLQAASSFGLLKDDEHPIAFIPGEAAAFVLLEPLTRARARGARIEGIIEGASVASEPCHRLSGDPSVGVALASTIEATLEGLPDKGRNTGLVIGDLNGDSFRATEWGYAIVRLLQRYPWLQDQRQWYPADAFGEVGAATGAVGICTAVRAFARDYAGTDDVLMWLSSDDGRKGSLCLRNPGSN